LVIGAPEILASHNAFWKRRWVCNFVGHGKKYYFTQAINSGFHCLIIGSTRETKTRLTRWYRDVSRAPGTLRCTRSFLGVPSGCGTQSLRRLVDVEGCMAERGNPPRRRSPALGLVVVAGRVVLARTDAASGWTRSGPREAGRNTVCLHGIASSPGRLGSNEWPGKYPPRRQITTDGGESLRTYGPAGVRLRRARLLSPTYVTPGFFLGRPRGLPPILVLAGGAGCGFACGFASSSASSSVSSWWRPSVRSPNGESRRSTVDRHTVIVAILDSSGAASATRAHTACSSRLRNVPKRGGRAQRRCCTDPRQRAVPRLTGIRTSLRRRKGGMKGGL